VGHRPGAAAIVVGLAARPPMRSTRRRLLSPGRSPRPAGRRRRRRARRVRRLRGWGTPRHRPLRRWDPHRWSPAGFTRRRGFGGTGRAGASAVAADRRLRRRGAAGGLLNAGTRVRPPRMPFRRVHPSTNGWPPQSVELGGRLPARQRRPGDGHRWVQRHRSHPTLAQFKHWWRRHDPLLHRLGRWVRRRWFGGGASATSSDSSQITSWWRRPSPPTPSGAPPSMTSAPRHGG